jgi:ATP-dependent DNA helicase RecG
MQRTTNKLYKIFSLEAEFGYTNKAVVGGLEKLSTTWVAEARADGFLEEKIQKVMSLLNKYPSLEVPERRNALIEIGNILNITGIKNLPELQTTKNELPSLKNSAPKQNTENQTTTITRGRIQKKSGVPSSSTSTVFPSGLSAPTNTIRGIGEKQSQLLAKLGLYTLEDMIYNFPRRYDDYSELKLIKDLKYGEEVTILAYIKSFSTFTTRNKNRKIVQAVVSDDTGSIQLMWFNQEYHLRYLRKNMFLSISGKIEQYMGRLVMYHPDYEQIDQEQLNTLRIVPVYSLTAQLSQRWLRRAMFNVIKTWAPTIPEFMTEYILKDANLMDLSTSLHEIHFPESKENLTKARYRLAFDEIFLLQLGLLQQKNEWMAQQGRTFEVADEWLIDQIRNLPYELTGAQFRVLTELRDDLKSGHPMNRLLQGDVGSGKTVVAALGMSVVLKNGSQGAFMAPTSILAEQHYHSLKQLLVNPEDNNALLKEEEIQLLIGDTSENEKQRILSGLADGSIKLVVGTHALIEDPVVFKDLQTVVVDEQHRFGVSQRAA